MAPTFSGPVQIPLDDVLGDKTDKAYGQPQKQHKRTKLARLGLPGQVPDDEQHEHDQGTHAIGHEKLGKLLFRHSKHSTSFRKNSAAIVQQSAHHLRHRGPHARACGCGFGTATPTQQSSAQQRCLRRYLYIFLYKKTEKVWLGRLTPWPTIAPHTHFPLYGFD